MSCSCETYYARVISVSIIPQLFKGGMVFSEEKYKNLYSGNDFDFNFCYDNRSIWL